MAQVINLQVMILNNNTLPVYLMLPQNREMGRSAMILCLLTTYPPSSETVFLGLSGPNLDGGDAAASDQQRCPTQCPVPVWLLEARGILL